MHISRYVHGGGQLTGAGIIPTPSDGVIIRLASIAAQVKELLVLDTPLDKTPVGLKAVRNARRRTVEGIMVLLADTEVRNYMAELERLGLLPVKR